MHHVVIGQWANILVYVCLGLAAIIGLYKFILLEYRTARIRNAPEVTVRATVYYKDPDCFPVPAGRTTNYVYHIIFHTESGRKVHPVSCSTRQKSCGGLLWMTAP